MNTTYDVEPIDRAEEAGRCVDMMLTSEPWITLGLARETGLTILNDRGKEVYAVRDGHGVAGFIVLEMRGFATGYVQILCVRSDCRGRGVGSALLQWAEDRIFRDSPNAFICVSSFNPDARRLYERRGFELVGVLRDFIVTGYDEALLRKTRGTWAEFRRKQQLTADT